jgi:hypothetical protein
MQILTPSDREIPAEEHVQPTYPLRCPLCSESLVPLHNSYRCSRCSYQFCAGCEPVETEPLDPARYSRSS